MFCDFAVLVACATGFCIDRKTRVFDRFGVQNPITPAIVGFDLIDDRCTFGWALNAISDFVWGMVLQIMMGCKKMVAKTVCCNWRRKTKWRWISAQRLRFRQMLIAVDRARSLSCEAIFFGKCNSDIVSLYRPPFSVCVVRVCFVVPS